MTREEIEMKRKSTEEEIKILEMSIKPQEDKIRELQKETKESRDRIKELERTLKELDWCECKTRLKEWVDSQFTSKDPEGEYNMILLQKGSFGDGRYFWNSDILEDYEELLYGGTDWERFWNSDILEDSEELLYGGTDWEREKYNKYAHPLPEIIKDSSTGKILADFDNILPRMKDPDESTNEYWNKFFAVTRDYKIVEFIMRDDGLLLNNEEPEIIDTLI